MMPTPRIRVLCVDDHRIVREGIALLIGRQSDIEVVGLAAGGEEAVSLFRRHRPDVTLMDLRLRTMSGVDAIRAIRQDDPAARVIVLTMYEGHEDVYRALRAGAVAYLLKNVRSSELVQTIRDVHAGKRLIGADVEQRLAERAARPALTPREITVMEFLAQGMRNNEIAASLGVSEGTVQVHLKNILAKLGVHDRTAAVGVALRRGIVHVEQRAGAAPNVQPTPPAATDALPDHLAGPGTGRIQMRVWSDVYGLTLTYFRSCLGRGSPP